MCRRPVALGGVRKTGLLTQWTLGSRAEVLRRREGGTRGPAAAEAGAALAAPDTSGAADWHPPVLRRLPVPGRPGGPMLRGSSPWTSPRSPRPGGTTRSCRAVSTTTSRHGPRGTRPPWSWAPGRTPTGPAHRYRWPGASTHSMAGHDEASLTATDPPGTVAVRPSPVAPFECDRALTWQVCPGRRSASGATDGC